MEIHDLFTWVDWAVLFGYLALTTWIGHLMKGQQASIKDFFLGGRTLPWQAVSGSIIATEISGVTFIGVPAMLFAIGGDFTYLQWAIGSILARIVVGMCFVRVYYENEIYSPYDYMSNRLGSQVKTLATIVFSIGSILAQSVRVLVAAIPLQIVTGMQFEVCIVIIGLFAIGWTLMGGMRTVIWTDVLQFGLFVVGGTISLIWLVSNVDGGFGGLWNSVTEAEKSTFWNFSFGPTEEFPADGFAGPDWLLPFRAELEYTFWIAIFAVPFQNLAAFGVDQLNAQRMFCCKGPQDAKKAIIWSSVGQLLTLLMMMVGAALWAYYSQNPPSVAEAASFDWDAEELKAGNGDAVFPTWIVSTLPTGLSGLILAGVFAAAISSLDSILAALSQTTLSLFYRTEGGNSSLTATNEQLMRKSRILVVVWGIVLTLFTYALYKSKDSIPIVPLAFGLTTYTVGPMLAMFLLALRGRGSARGILIGFIVSFLVTTLFRTDLWGLIVMAGRISNETLAALPTLELTEEGRLTAVYSYVWLWPLGTLITWLCGRFIPGGRKAV